MHVVEHPDDDFTRALDHAEDGRLFRRQGSAPTRALQAAAAGFPSGFGDLVRLAFVARHDIDLVTFDHAGQGYRLFFLSMPVRRCSVMYCKSSLFRSSSWAICWLDRFSPIKYRHSTQTDSGW